MPHPFLGAEDVCYIEKKVAKLKAFLGKASLYLPARGTSYHPPLPSLPLPNNPDPVNSNSNELWGLVTTELQSLALTPTLFRAFSTSVARLYGLISSTAPHHQGDAATAQRTRRASSQGAAAVQHQQCPLPCTDACLPAAERMLIMHSASRGFTPAMALFAAVGISATPFQDNLRHFNVLVTGPQSSPYECAPAYLLAHVPETLAGQC